MIKAVDKNFFGTNILRQITYYECFRSLFCPLQHFYLYFGKIQPKWLLHKCCKKYEKDLADLELGSTKNVCNFAKVSYFWGCFFHIFISKEIQNWFFVPFRVRTKKLTSVKMGKLSIFALKCTFLGQNRLDIYNQL